MSVTAPDVLGEVYDFLQAFIEPTPEHIIRGWQNRAALPNDVNYVVLTLINAARRGTNVAEWLIPDETEDGETETAPNLPSDASESAETEGNPEKEETASTGQATGQETDAGENKGEDQSGEGAGATPQVVRSVRMLTMYEVQVDFCGVDEERVIQQAWGLVMLARDTTAVEFFKARGLSSCYADDPRSLPFSNDLNQWEVRYSVTLRLSGWSRADISRDAFSSVNIWLEEADYHHRIEKGA